MHRKEELHNNNIIYKVQLTQEICHLLKNSNNLEIKVHKLNNNNSKNKI